MAQLQAEIERLQQSVDEQALDLVSKNRELEIEGSLERVRARTMAMHKSDELAEVSGVLYQELIKIGIKGFVNCGFVEVNEENRGQKGWTTMPDGSQAEGYYLPLDGDAVLNERFKAWKEQTPVFHQSVGGERLRKHMAFATPNLGSNQIEEMVSENLPDPCIFYCFNFKQGYLHIITGNTIAQDHEAILVRFTKVFEQTYTRFLDLQKAEAQAREAQIEAALERVRSASMAMHKSEELANVASVCFQELISLGAVLKDDGFHITLFNEDSEVAILWMTEPGGTIISRNWELDLKTFPPSLITYQKWKETPCENRNEMLTAVELSTDEIQTVIHLLSEHPVFSEMPLIQEWILNPPSSWIVYDAFFSNGTFVIDSFSGSKKPDSLKIHSRFAKVFEQTYTRFLDLQKAEAQAREAQIEVALEKVRSRSMAMHKSEELVEVAELIWNEVSGLQIPISSNGFSIMDPDRPMGKWYSYLGKAQIKLFKNAVTVELGKDKYLLKSYQSWKSGERMLINDLTGTELEGHLRNLMGAIPALQDQLKTGVPPGVEAQAGEIPKRHLVYHFNFGAGILFFASEVPLDEIDTLERFTGVFEQTYTRFLDLQKAEAQAREAQIEAALERVRSRTMGMQKSQELCETATVLFQQLFALGIKPGACAFSILNDKDQTGEVWISSDGNVYDNSFIHPYHTDPAQERIFEAWKAGKTFHLDDLENEELINHLQFLSKHMPIFDMLEAANDDLPKRIVIHAIYFSQGFIGLTYESPQLEHIPTFIRFAKVFEQTYTRFLDLQKAEAQAREAQIEAALERIRSASMAMHKSEELPQVALTFLIQIEELAIPVLGVALSELNTETNTCVTYFADNTAEGKNRELSISKEFEINEFWLSKESIKQMESGKKEFTLTAEGERLELWILWIEKIFSKMRAERLRSANLDKVYFHSFQFHDYSSILFSSLTPLPEEYRPIIQRLVSTFRLSYLRFLDLQKSEAQAREAEIQLALERVRARTMAMQKSEELSEVATIMFQKIQELGTKQWTSGFEIWEPDQISSTAWVALPDGSLADPMTIPFNEDPYFKTILEARQIGKSFFVFESSGKSLENTYKYMSAFSSPKKFFDESENLGFQIPTFQITHCVFFSFGFLIFITYEPVPEMWEIFKRFANVFEQTYTRFLDLQKAEAQAREAQIEAALERVRAQTMAMHNSEDVGKCIVKMFSELTALGVDEDTRFGIGILNHENENNQLWTARKNGDEVTMHIGNIDMASHPLLKSARKAWKQQVPFHKYVLEGEDLLDYYKMLNNAPDYKIQIEIEKLPKKEIQHCFIFDHGFFYAFSPREFQPELIHITQRFSSLFAQTYRRYLDLVKAEEQAREAKIEAALERVRSRTMAMHQSSELNEVSVLLYKELMNLGITDFFNCGYVELHEKNKVQYAWVTRDDGTFLGKLELPLHGDEILNKRYDAWKKQKPLFSQVLNSNQLKNHLAFISPQHKNKDADDVVKRFPNPTIFYNANFKHGYLHMNTGKYLDDEGESILIRFTQVFAQTYTRFLDLQKAEAQARESQIEAALERVRSASMAMYESKDLYKIVNVVLSEMNSLDISMSAVSIYEFRDKSKDMFFWAAAPGMEYPQIVTLPFKNSSFFTQFNEARETEKSFFSDQFSEQESHSNWQHYFNYNPVPAERQKYLLSTPGLSRSCTLYKNTAISIFRYDLTPFDENENSILRRFGQVFEQSYTRFLDLQKAEAQAREATKQASLDRVRAEIASMRDAKDLERITPLVWKELQSLGVPFFRCGVMLVNEQEEILDFYLSNPEGEALAALHLDFNNSEITRKGVSHWREKEIYIEHWDQNQFLEFMKSLMDQGQISNAATYQGGEKPPTGLTLQFVPFSQGMVYVGTETDLSEEELDLVKALGNSLSVAYARYEDFTKLDLAKAKAEKALKDLEAAQEQLVQQEKLASLGQLTAGIAHEIKNPLNFVNNFSDLSRELIEEVFEELENLEDSDAKEEIIAILNDVKANLSKVHEHGTRADSIVSSMLQHSRASGSKREPKPFNPLVKEFVNLSFHGMRAGKSPINVEIDLQLDPKIGEVTLISEDFSRVILNLCNNAFDAMRDKLKSGESADYLAKLTVKTSLENGKVILSIQDNGSGIPKEILDKILQPFFTTKKGTEGTGLGLSITHDIVKSHGGEITVNSEEGIGSNFLIKLGL